jgi:hypothetical protein
MFPGSARRYRRRQRRRRRRALMLAVVLALTFAAYAEIHARGHDDPATVTNPVHGNPPSRGTALAAAGQDVSWADFHGIQLPVSAQAGPHHTRGGLAWGFADTPRGALLAAVNIGVRTAALWGPAIYWPTITYQVTGRNTAALLRADASDYAALRAAADVRAGQPAGRAYAVEAAYRFAAWAARRAVLSIVTEGLGSSGKPVLAVTRITVIWRKGDWRVVAPAGGDWGNAARPVSSLTSYTTFPGER